MYKIIENTVLDSSDYNGQKEWWLVISLEEGMELFYPGWKGDNFDFRFKLCGDYQGSPEISQWLWCTYGYRGDGSEGGSWRTMNRKVAEKFLAHYLCEVDVRS